MFIGMMAAALSCSAIDGDTLRCGAERVRLIGIDAPEMPGHCRAGRQCVAGDPIASRDALAALIEGRGVNLIRSGQDRYGRTLALATVWREGRAINLACAQVNGGKAVYVARWDRWRALRRAC